METYALRKRRTQLLLFNYNQLLRILNNQYDNFKEKKNQLDEKYNLLEELNRLKKIAMQELRNLMSGTLSRIKSEMRYKTILNDTVKIIKKLKAQSS